MKYFVIAALLSQASAADGCKGLKGEYFSKSGCEGKADKTFNFAEGQDAKGKTIKDTGKCVPHNPPKASVTTEAATLEEKTKTEKVAKDAEELRDAQTSLFVCSEMKKEGGFCDPKHKEDVAKFFGVKYTELKTKYAAY